MRLLGVPIESPQAAVERTVADLTAIARFARTGPAQFARLLEIAQDGVDALHALLALAERLERRAEAIVLLGERLESQAESIVGLSQQLDAQAESMVALGARMEALGERIDDTGILIAERAGQVVTTGNELIGVLPALERAIDMAGPLEGAIDRIGRFVDRLPGGGPARRAGAGDTGPSRRSSTGGETRVSGPSSSAGEPPS
jgi:hypothetical protein